MSAAQRQARRDAMAVFYDLGWHTLDWDEIPTAPLGTPAQRKIALAGFRDGELSANEVLPDGTYGWESEHLPDRTERLVIFAIRQGVTASRAADLAWRLRGAQPDALVAAARERGEAFTRTLVGRLAVRANRFGALAGSTFAPAVVRMAEHFALPLTDHVEYLRDFVVIAAQHFGRLGRLERAFAGLPSEDELRPRFVELVSAAVATGAPSEGAVTRAIEGGVERGWMTRSQAIDLAIAGIDAATKQNQRRGWTTHLTDGLAITDAELASHIDALMPAFGSGDSTLAQRLLVPAISVVDEHTLPDLAVVSTTLTARAVRAVVLSAFAGRTKPADGDVADAVLEVFADAASDSDPKIARTAVLLREKWGGGSAAPAPVETGDERWLPTPPLWSLPRFTPATGGLDELPRLTSLLVTRRSEHVDVETERFLVLANEVAAVDPEGLRRAWTGVDREWIPGLAAVWNWVNGHAADALVDSSSLVQGVLEAREGAVMQRLGELPVILSTPSHDDLTIDADDLLARLRAYAAAGVAASEGDLFLAVLRTDPRDVSAETRTAFAAIDLPIVGRNGKHLPHTAGKVVSSWLEEPLSEPKLVLRHGAWETTHLVRIPAFDGLPRRLSSHFGGDDICAESVPWWGAAADRDLHDGRGVHDFSVRARQRARSREPLGAGFAANLLYAASASVGRDRGDIATAAIEAFERGLLTPGLADPALLSWRSDPLRLAAFATGARSLVDDGLLSVLWPLFDGVLERSAAAVRPYPGSAEVADFLLEYAPDVRAAASSGRAPADALNVPGLRAFAARSGSSRAPRAARLALAVLGEDAPAVAPLAPVVVAAAAMDDTAFAAAWQSPAGSPPHIVDGARIEVVEVETHLVKPEIGLDVSLRDEPDMTYRIHKLWWYDIGNEGQVQARRRDNDARVYLHWDAEVGRLVPSAHRDWLGQVDGPLNAPRAEDVPPWTVTITASALTLALHPGTSGDKGVPVLATLARRGLAHPDSVRDAARSLYPSDLVIATRLTRVIDERPDTIAVYWPLLTEAFRAAADGAKPPAWLGRVADTAIARADVLAEATRRGLIPAEAWEPLARLAARTGKTAGLVKARALATALGLKDIAS